MTKAQQPANEVKKESQSKFVIVANANKTKDNKKFMFNIDGKRYILCKATVNDWRYSSFSGEYLVKEIIDIPETNDTTESAL